MTNTDRMALDGWRDVPANYGPAKTAKTIAHRANMARVAKLTDAEIASKISHIEWLKRNVPAGANPAWMSEVDEDLHYLTMERGNRAV